VTDDKMTRIKERNRKYARETRQRKKAHTMLVEEKYSKLQEEQTELKQSLSDLLTANIMLSLSADSLGMKLNSLDPAGSTNIDLVSTSSLNSTSSDDTIDDRESEASRKKVRFCDELTQPDTKFGERYGNLFAQEMCCTRREQNRLRSKYARANNKRALNALELRISKYEDENRRLRNSVHKLRNKSVVIPTSITAAQFPSDSKHI